MDTESLHKFRELLSDFLNQGSSKHSTASQKQVQQAIDEFTKTKECWGTVTRLLLAETDANVLTLASNILKNKFQYDFGQLTSQMFSQVHGSLLQVTTQQSKPNNALRNNLGVCVALIYLHKAAQIGQLLGYLSKCFSQNQNRNYIYTVLEVLPQQVDNDKAVVQEEKRQWLREYMKTIQKLVLVQLNNVSQVAWHDGLVKRTTLLRCFSNWVNLHSDNEIMKSLPGHFLLRASFEGLQDSDLNDDCKQCIKAALKSIESPSVNAQLYKYLAQEILEFFKILKLQMDEQETYMCEQYVEILCTFGRVSRSEFVKNPSEDYRQYLSRMVGLTAEPELQCENVLQRFWLKFLEDLNEDRGAVAFYKPQLEQLFVVLCKVTQFSMYECEQLNQRSTRQLEAASNAFETKLSSRKEVQDLFSLLSQILTPSECLLLSLNSLNSLKLDNPNFWPELECYLNPLENVIESFTGTVPALDQLVLKILQIKCPFIIVQKTIIKVFSACSSIYVSSPEFSQKIFNFLVDQLKVREVSSTASRAFQTVCTSNPEFVLSNIQSFVKILHSYKNNQNILGGVMKALSKNVQTLNKYLPQLFSLYIQEMGKTSQIKEAKQVLQKLIVIFREVTKEDPSDYSQVVSLYFGQLWTLMKPILQRQCKTDAEESLLEKCTKVIKYALRSLKNFFYPFMDEVYLTVLESYKKYPVSSYVYMVEVLVTVMYDVPQFQAPVSSLFQTTCNITFCHLQKLGEIEQNSHLTEDFFGMLSRFVRFTPQIINNCCHLQKLLQFMILICGVQNGQIARVFYAFAEDLYMQYWEIHLLKEYAEKEKPLDPIILDRTPEVIASRQRVRPLIVSSVCTFLKRVIKHLSDVPSTSVRNCIVEVLMAEIKAFPVQNTQIWIQILGPIQEDILTDAQKNKILENLGCLNSSKLEYLESALYLMTKRYVHRLTRSVGQ